MMKIKKKTWFKYKIFKRQKKLCLGYEVKILFI